MNPATQTARKLHRALSMLAAKGATEGERTAAASKLARLEKRYNFTAAVPLDERDIFADLIISSEHRSAPRPHVSRG